MHRRRLREHFMQKKFTYGDKAFTGTNFGSRKFFVQNFLDQEPIFRNFGIYSITREYNCLKSQYKV